MEDVIGEVREKKKKRKEKKRKEKTRIGTCMREKPGALFSDCVFFLERLRCQLVNGDRKPLFCTDYIVAALE
jgi:hypothetical protein